ncbi:GNAT family N-acetyltransferase [Terracidiphilus gabretensis]|uniref:GNAT family N-acetyltransferase n=1 Tax=Terracidiphilus gabretensis TaxID=1577687 RepID=UPI00071B8A85|nr:N-acetyltransferase [Terracidiphilus gabretensis]
MQYRLYHPADFEQLYAIEEACFDSVLRFDRHYMKQLTERASSVTWTAEWATEESTRLAGFAIVEWTRMLRGIVAYIQTIEVDPAFRRRGVASELLRLTEDSARQAHATHIWLHVDETNAAAIALYCACGYRRHGHHPHYYQNGHGAEIYAKPLGKG